MGSWTTGRIVAATVVGTLAMGAGVATADATEPWVDPDPSEPPERYALGDDFGIRINSAEYRNQFTFVNPIALNEEANRRFNVLEHRGRIGTTVDYLDKVKLTVGLDLLDGVLWGDNGTFGADPSSDVGVNIAARDPNLTVPCIAVRNEDEPLVPSSYGFGLCEGTPVKVRRLFGQVNTPIGAIRAGRQPLGVGMGVQNATGDGRENRWGVANEGDQADRILFATKPLEAFKDKEDRDLSEDRGLITAVMYDRVVSDFARAFGDDVHQVATALSYRNPDFGVGRDMHALLFYAHRWNTEFDSAINAIGGRFTARFGDFHVGAAGVVNIGSTREISSANSLVTNDPIVDDDILQWGGRVTARYDHQPESRQRPMVTGYIEGMYASGDRDPQPGTPLTQFRWSEDTNVGLLLFEHVVRFQSGRAAAAGAEILRRLDATSFSAERIDSRGAFTNAMAIFPQFDIRPHDDVLFRLGVLVAWAAEDVVDSLQSLQNKDGTEIEDDLVNFVGGRPGNFYGTELDGRFQWRFLEHFALDLEAAVLFPGDALEDINGAANNSFLTQARTTFFF
ncbi:MAG: alginate export family protein [Myxococcota bacterium]